MRDLLLFVLGSEQASVPILLSFPSGFYALPAFSFTLKVSMDGPNVNWKFVDMFSHQLIDEYSISFLNIGSCGLHIIHGAFKHGSERTGWELDNFFSSIFKLFKGTPARRDDYTRVTGSSVFAFKFCKHRWVQNVPVAERAIEMLPHLLKYVKAVQEKKLPNPTTQSFQTVKNMLQDVLLEVKINFFISIAKEVTPFLTIYQTDRVMLPFLGDDLHRMLKSVMSRVIKNSVLKEHGATPQGLMKMDISDKSNQCTAHKVDLGFVATEQLKKLVAAKKVTDKQVLELKMEWKESVLTILKHRRLKSPLGYRTVSALQCLNPQMLVSKPEKCIEKFQVVLKALVNTKKLKECDVDLTKQQFVSFLDEEVPQHVSRLNSFDHTKEGHHIDKLFYDMLASKKSYEKLWAVLKSLLTLSHGQATVERGFSTNKQVSIDNLQERSFVAMRQIQDHIHTVKGSLNVNITKQMISSVAAARQRYMAYLEEERKKKQKEASSMKRKSLVEELDELKAKKRLESEAAALVKSADDYSVKAESTKNIDKVRQLVAQSNGHRSSSKRKLEEASKIDSEIDCKLQELKDI